MRCFELFLCFVETSRTQKREKGKKNEHDKKKSPHLPGRYLAFSCLLLMSAHSAGSRSSMQTSRSAFCLASATAIAVPNEPPPKTATLNVESSAEAEPYVMVAASIESLAMIADARDLGTIILGKIY